MSTTIQIERRRAPRQHEPIDELVGLLIRHRTGDLPTGLWNRLTAGEAVTLSNAVSARRRSET